RVKQRLVAVAQEFLVAIAILYLLGSLREQKFGRGAQILQFGRSTELVARQKQLNLCAAPVARRHRAFAGVQQFFSLRPQVSQLPERPGGFLGLSSASFVRAGLNELLFE